jgi:hypothetical protein
MRTIPRANMLDVRCRNFAVLLAIAINLSYKPLNLTSVIEIRCTISTCEVSI